MPNLGYDPQNPTDLMGRPLREGDTVAWGTTYGKSAALAVCTVEKIRFTRPVAHGYGIKNVECDRALAERYTLSLRPIKTTGSSPWRGPKDKLKTVLLVQNVVKLEPLDSYIIN